MDDRARLIRIGGTVAWLAVGVPLLLAETGSLPRLGLWFASFLAFGAAHLAASRRTEPPLALLAVEVAAVLGIVLTLCNGFEGTLLVLIAMQLGGRLPRRGAMVWIVVQTLLFAAAITVHWSLRPALLLVPPYLGFQLLAYFAFELMARETAVRRALEASNAELRALQQALTDAGRIAERLRISRELHDAIGHHLTALSLNLEVALQRTSGEVKETVSTAQTLARGVLAEIRNIVASMDEDRGIDLADAIVALAEDIPQPHIHFQLGEDLRVDNAESARAVLRCAQEIITNAARHSGARNLWIVVAREDGALRIRAHDDGRGAESPRDGFGLRAMRTRIEDLGGELRIESHAQRGFNVTAVVPVEAQA
ncbi:MAG TPA: sensor histidine kinase [Thermoanaerobaculia bacterium]